MDFNHIFNILIKGLLFIHIAAGFSALATFWVPIFTKKGGLNHRKLGLWYVKCMWIVVISAALLSIKNLILGAYLQAFFLGFLALITAKPLWKGIIVLNNKKQLSPVSQRLDLVLSLTIISCGASMLAAGILLRGEPFSIILIAFGIIGLTTTSELVNQLKQAKLEWMKEHISSMCTTGIAAHTAFFVFGASQFIQNVFHSSIAWLPWVFPSVIGTIGINWAVRKYQPAAKAKL